MARDTPVDLVISRGLWGQLQAHLFPGDGDEHGAVIAAGIAQDERGIRLLAREVLPAREGQDYVAGERGYRMLVADFVRDCALHCRDERLAYLAVHNHGGTDEVSFSDVDLRSHERGYPALLDITGSAIVGGLVFAKNAVAGDLWFADGRRVPLRMARVIGATTRRLYPRPPSRSSRVAPAYDRQARLFGDRGQALLAAERVGIVGVGGGGSIVSELLARLGVGTLLLVDPDRIEISNVPRVLGSTWWDALGPLTSPDAPKWLRARAGRHARRKVDVGAAAARRAHPRIVVRTYGESVVDSQVAAALSGCDYLVLAADTMQARLVFNALVHQYLIPGVQIGAKVEVEPETGAIGAIHSVVRPVTPESGCLWCNGLILPSRLAEEALSPEERRAQQYVPEQEVHAPSVVTLNAVAASLAANDYLFRTLGLRSGDAHDDYTYFDPRGATSRTDLPRRDAECAECGLAPRSRLARGDSVPLPTRPASHERVASSGRPP